MSKHRKPGQWREVASGRSKTPRETRTGRGLTNIPNVGETGSAAYRRLSPGRKRFNRAAK